MNTLLNGFAPISLDEMNGVKLMNRTDTKFVTTTDKLLQLLLLAQQDYYVQQIDGLRIADYDTTYFDTERYDMYNQHQVNHTNRQKLRFRNYVGSHLQFMEVKTKNNHGRTRKKRIEVSDMNIGDEAKRDFLSRHLQYDSRTLMPTLNNRFRRITLVNKGKTERLTIDTELTFHNLVTGTTLDMGPLVIIELKRDGMVCSPILETLRQLHIHPHGYSKYCMGSVLTNSHLRVNRFKRKLIEINKLLTH